MEQPRIGVIGGSGVYDMGQLSDVSEIRLDTRSAPRRTHMSWAQSRASEWLFCPATPVGIASVRPTKQPGQHLRIQNARRRVPDLYQCLRQPATAIPARRYRHTGSIV